MTHAFSASSLALFQSLQGYKTARLSGDVVAGLTVWAVLVPEALAYATVAGVSPVVGLYAAPGALLFYAAFGSSRHLIVGPMSATAALSAATVGDLVAPSDEAFLALTTSVAIVAGLIATVAALIKLGFVANFISEPVLKGFIVGMALTIIVGQLPSMLGVEGADGNFFEKLWAVVTSLDEVDGTTALIGLLSLSIVLGLRRLAPRVPGSLVVVVFGVSVVSLFSLDSEGVAIVGSIESGLPDLGVPSGVEGRDLLDLAPGTIGIVLVGFAEGLGAAKNYARRNGYEVDPNRELLGLGAANFASGLSGGMVVNGSLSKTAVNGGAGATSQVSGLVVAGLTILTFLFLTGLFEDLPEATLGAIVVAALIELVDFPAIARLYYVQSRELGRVLGPAARADFLAALATLLGVLVFDTLIGLFIGIVASVLLLLYRAYRPRLAILGRVPGTDQFADVGRHPENQRIPGVAIVRVESGLFFANAEGVRERVEEIARQDGVRAIILDAETVPFIDLTAAEMLVDLEATLKATGKQLLLAGEIAPVRDVLATAEPEASLPAYRTVAEAVAALTGGE